MREIKFRAWNGKAMEHGGFCIHATGSLIKDSALGDVFSSSPVMQYTGLKDKNGVDIYEGDIVRSAFKNNEPELMVVEWDTCNPCFVLSYVENDSGYKSPEYDFVQCDMRENEVIGNIYENPELLEN